MPDKSISYVRSSIFASKIINPTHYYDSSNVPMIIGSISNSLIYLASKVTIQPGNRTCSHYFRTSRSIVVNGCFNIRLQIIRPSFPFPKAIVFCPAVSDNKYIIFKSFNIVLNSYNFVFYGCNSAIK